MAIETLGAVLRHMNRLFTNGTVVGLGDSQLLERFVAEQDSVAFEVLVTRHGPMVLSICRSVLRDPNDAEDAFQATFLVLAQKASTIRAHAALGGWLHLVARRIALEANAVSDRRRAHERQAGLMASRTSPSATMARDELLMALHEEIARLPEKFRLAVVVCDLQGISQVHAAAQLRWSERTLRRRLAQGRERLKGRLSRRGLAPAGATIGALLTREAQAAIPVVLCEMTGRAVLATTKQVATAGVVSAAAVAFSERVARTLFMSRLKMALTAGLAAVAIGTVGVAALELAPDDDPGPAMKRADGPHETRAAEVASSSEAALASVISVRGRVVGPDGKPVARATLRAAYLGRADRDNPETTSAPDGRFELPVPPLDQRMLMAKGVETFPWLVASASGFGPGWATKVLKSGAGEITIRLVNDGPPIEGRIVDLEGRPVAGAQVNVLQLYYSPVRNDSNRETGDLSAWLKVFNEHGVQKPHEGLSSLPATFKATAGTDGRFRITGIGCERVAQIVVSAPTIAATEFYVMTHNGPEARCKAPFPATRMIVVHAPRFELVAEPTQPIEGIIRDKDTGRPLPGVKLQGVVVKKYYAEFVRGVEATTDGQGRYRLNGLPKNAAYQVSVKPGEGQPYAPVSVPISSASPGLDPVVFDITLKRGIVLRGRVTDKATGKPVAGYVSAFTFSDNPHVAEFPGYEGTASVGMLKTDGRYEVIALPGQGFIACRSDRSRYRSGVGAETIRGYDPRTKSFAAMMQMPFTVENYHVLAPVDLDPKADSATVDLQIDPGRSVTVTVVDLDGKPVLGTKAEGLSETFGNQVSSPESATFEVRGLDPSKPRRVTVTHFDRELIGAAFLTGNETGVVTIRLRPWGTITGRIVDEAGKPRPGLRLTYGSRPNRPDEGEILGTKGDGGALIGEDGRFRIDGFVPGAEYALTAADKVHFIVQCVLFRDLKVAPGKVRDLGDLKFVPPKEGKP